MATIPGSEERVDEGRDGGALCSDEQQAEEQHHQDDGREPKLLPGSKEGPELLDERSHAVSLVPSQNWFFMDSPGGPGGIRSIQYVRAPRSFRRRSGSFPASRMATQMGVMTTKNIRPRTMGLTIFCKSIPKRNHTRFSR